MSCCYILVNDIHEINLISLQVPALAKLVNSFLNLLGYISVVLEEYTSTRLFALYQAVLDSPGTTLISSSAAEVFRTAYSRDPQCIVDTVVYLDEDLDPADSPAEVSLSICRACFNGLAYPFIRVTFTFPLEFVRRL